MAIRNRSTGDRTIFARWVRATCVGWILGVPLIIALALVGEAVGIGGAQVLVGAGMGMGVGLMQGRALRGVLNKSALWFWSCVIGLAVPFLVTDIAKAAGWDYAYSLQIAVAVGGLIVGVLQAFILRRYFHSTGWWVVGSAVGWTLASGMTAVADVLSRRQLLRRLWGAVAYLGIVTGGGLVLGLVTIARLDASS